MPASLWEIAKRAYSSIETVRASYDIARMAIERGVPGDFVECGVGAGANAAAMALAITEEEQPDIEWSPTRHIVGNAFMPVPCVHLFDSFTGIPQAGPEDVEFLEAGHKPGLSAHSRTEVEANLKEWGLPLELFVFHEGDFAETVRFVMEPYPFGGPAFDTERIKQISVLRLDGDLYESTKVCIEHLYPLVSRGGWVIVDDWDLSGARKAVLDYMRDGFGPIYFQGQNGAQL